MFWKSFPKQQIVDKIDEIQKTEDLTPMEEYVFEEHKSLFKPNVTARDIEFIPTTRTGESALYGDMTLHQSLRLPDYISVAKDTGGIIHEAFNPALVHPEFATHSHESVPHG